jgi:type IV pilus assembly protein PilW
LFASNSASRSEIDKASRQVENGRYAMQVLADEIRHAGYYGPLANAPSVVTSTTPCDPSAAQVKADMGLPLRGYAGAATAGALDAEVGCLATITGAGYKAGTAVLVVRRAGTSTSSVPVSDSFNIQVSGCAGDPVTEIVSGSAAGDYTLHMKNSTTGCIPIGGAPVAPIAPFYARIFYVSTCSQVDCSAANADSIPTLKRLDATPGGMVITPIVDGIDNLQFDYGLDTTAGDQGAPDTFTAIPTAAQWPNVTAARVHILARNNELTQGYTDPKSYTRFGVAPADKFKRHAYSEVVRLNNSAGRRE